MKLFYLKVGDEINNFDLFVSAENEADARAFWLDYYGEEEDALNDARVFEIQPSGQAGALSWHGGEIGGSVMESK